MKLLFILLCALLHPFLPAQEPGAELVLRAYQHTYPDRVKGVSLSGGEWAIQAGGEVFYWAEGRLLPAALRPQWQKYRPYGFSPYPGEVPAPEAYAPGRIEELRLQGKAEARGGGADHYYGFQAALYGGTSRREIERALRKIRFLDRELTVHQDITGALARIDRRIREIAAEDRETAAFIGSINSIGGYNWREIRGTRRMSYHSWGLAVDIQPAELNNRVIYWFWEHNHNDNWMLVPLRRRWQPPEAVIRAFENEGFIWGGKWALYDNMHFEFRPELHEINRLLAAERSGAPEIAKPPGTQDLHHLFPQGFPEKGAFSLWERIGAFFHSLRLKFDPQNSV
ncbi:MAG: M15 family metallopeptidase [Treponema sp.]|jgi:hypothetical protein|nr:M15 family metallopeptidase [Treponema sp.]